MKQKIKNICDRLLRWIEASNLNGWDPYDALNSPFLSGLSQKNRILGIGFTQFLRYTPINTRKFWRIPAVRMTKTVSLVVDALLNLMITDIENKEYYQKKVRKELEWLKYQRLAGYHGACWGYSHDWRSRSMFLPKSEPSIVCTAFVARSFIKAYEYLGDAEYLDIACSACDFILKDIPRYKKGNTHCFSYVPSKLVLVHNANMLGAEILLSVYNHLQKHELLDKSLSSLYFSLADQNEDGSWFYDVGYEGGVKRKWVDNFHTGFMLEILLKFNAAFDNKFKEMLSRGIRYYKEHLFSTDGRPIRSLSAAYPVDLRDSSQALILFSKPGMETCNSLLSDVLDWTIQNMLLKNGLFASQVYIHYANHIPYIRFQAWILSALSALMVSWKDNN